MLVLTVVIGKAFEACISRVSPFTVLFLNQVVSVITFGSTWVKDAPFRAAAMNPYPLPGLMMLFLAVSLLLLLCSRSFLHMGRTVLSRTRCWRLMRVRLRRTSNRGTLAERKKLRETSRVFTFVVPASIALISCELLLIGSVMVNNAVLARRKFETNLKILGPYISPIEQATFEARFAAMERYQDYQAIRSDMKSSAVARARNSGQTFKTSRTHPRPGANGPATTP